MSTDQTKRRELWGRWVAALCARDLRGAEEAAEDMCDQDYIVHNPKLPDYGQGPAAAKAFAHYVIGHYSQIQLTLQDFFGEGDKTAARSTVRFTITATGQKVSYPVLNIMRWDGDKLAERWELGGEPEEQA
jgi:SnoaL-like protein